MAHLLVLNNFKGICLIDNWIRFSQHLCAEKNAWRHFVTDFRTDKLLRQAEKETDSTSKMFDLINFLTLRLYSVGRQAEIRNCEC